MGQPAQHQKHQPGSENKMLSTPEAFMKNYKAAGKLKDKVALITGGDSGIGRATSIGFAKEGANVAFMYYDEDKDAQETMQAIEDEGVLCRIYRGDIANKDFCMETVADVIETFGKLDIVVNNAGEQHVQNTLEDISEEQLKRTFETNIFGMFFLTQAALPHLKDGASIINTASITAYRGKKELIDYASTKGAVVAFTRSLASNLVDQGIRVNGVAPGPIWTPLICASFDAEQVAEFGDSAPMGRAGQPDEVAPSFIFLASDDSSYMTGQMLHPNGGTVIGG